jgi:4-amino-4-deoxy-L-arabinose transferase-like glycosyltransferase
LVWIVALAAVAIRLPSIIHQSGGQDEDYFAVAGWTLLQTGSPSIPYTPSLNERGVFYKANEILYALPPGFFLAEAGVFKFVGPSYAAGRLTSIFAGAATIVGVFHLGRRFFEPRSALFAATLFAFSRPFLFPATTARPDMLCTALLVWAFVLLIPVSREAQPSATQSARLRLAANPRNTVAAALLLGLALFTHPFAILGVILGIGWILLSSTDHKRLHILIVIAGAALGFAFWLPWIAKNPDLFRAQFGNNVLNRAGPGLLVRIVWPWEALWYQAKLFFELSGPWQSALFGGTLILAFIRLLFAPRTEPVLRLAWAAVLGLAILQGVHPSKGYWSFPTAFLCLTFARIIDACGRWKLLAGIIALALMIPGGGFKAAGVYLRHWGDRDYSHPELVKRLQDELPKGARYLVDVGCVFDWHLTGHQTLLALDLPQYYSSAGEPFDFLIVTRTGLEQQLPKALGAAERILVFGKRDDELAVYVEVWRR